MRYKDIEFRRTIGPDSTGHILDRESPEIVAWIRNEIQETCYTLCRFKEDDESWYMETVGDRFTAHEDSEAVMRVAKYALKILNTEKEFKEGTLESKYGVELCYN